MILSCQTISKSYGTVPILQDISFHMNEREKVAVVGINGAGKSTLFKIMIKELEPDSGNVIFSKGLAVGYLSQQQGLEKGCTIYNEVLKVKAEILKMEERIRELELEMKTASSEDLEKKLEEYTRLTHSFEQNNGYACRSEVTGVLKGLGFSEEEFEKQVDTLSGGQKTRVALGKLLLSKPDLILLDEPTNHLDMGSIAWLETFLSNYDGAVLVIAHDRYFLDKVVTKVVEIEQTKATVYEGNYTIYAEKKAKLRETALKHYLDQQKEIKRQEEVITKLKSYNREKSIKRAESREKLLDKMVRLEKPKEIKDKMNIRLEPNVVSGNDVLTAEGLKKAYGSNLLFEEVSFEIKREEKVAVIGDNGTGKTTLLKIINGMTAKDAGEIRLGSKVTIGYYDQEHQVLDPGKTIFAEIQETYPRMDNTEVRNVLAAFLFTGDDVFKLIRDVSGGERGRISLAKLMLSDANLLILDEPTNHLDMVSKEILEQAVANYGGTVLYVSHDRYFINKTATRILDLKNKTLLNYIGNYNYYIEKKEDVERVFFEQRSISHGAYGSSEGGKQVEREADSDPKISWEEQKREQAKERKRQNDLSKAEETVERLESEIESLNQELLKEEVYSSPPRLIEINQEKLELEEELTEWLERWEELASE